MLLLGDHSLYSFIDNIKMISEESEWPKEGQYIDFKDSNSEWVVGYIINRGTETLQVRSDGWSSKYDIVTILLLSFYPPTPTALSPSGLSLEATPVNKKNQVLETTFPLITRLMNPKQKCFKISSTNSHPHHKPGHSLSVANTTST